MKRMLSAASLAMMSFYNDDGKLTLEPGRRGQELGAPKPVTAVFEVK